MHAPLTISLSLLLVSGFALAQDPAENAGWHRLGESKTKSATATPATPAAEQAAATIPAQMTIKPGTYITVRMNGFLSSDRNQAGDAFTATLAKPIVIDGVVVAQSGQTVTGSVIEAKKAGRVSGTSRLGVQLNELSIVDGQQLPVQSQLVTRNGSTSVGRDAVAVAGTTGVGAAVGAAVNGGVGAGVGAGAGLVVGALGVLLTRGNPTVLYPEQMLTFRIEQPVTFSTERGLAAFRFVEPADYQTAPAEPRLVARPVPRPYYYGAGFYPYYPYAWGPGFGFGYGFYGRGYYRGFRR